MSKRLILSSFIAASLLALGTQGCDQDSEVKVPIDIGDTVSDPDDPTDTPVDPPVLEDPPQDPPKDPVIIDRRPELVAHDLHNQHGKISHNPLYPDN